MANGYGYIQNQRDDLSAQVKRVRRPNAWLRVLLLLAIALIVLGVWL